MIRTARQADIPRLVDLMQHVQKLHAEAHPGVFRAILDREPAAAFFAATLAKPENIVLLAEEGSATAGYLWCEERTTADTFYRPAAHTGYIHHVSVDPAHHRSGTGRALVAEALALLRGRGASSVGVDYWSFNDRARAFFHATGFSVQREICSQELG